MCCNLRIYHGTAYHVTFTCPTYPPTYVGRSVGRSPRRLLQLVQWSVARLVARLCLSIGRSVGRPVDRLLINWPLALSLAPSVGQYPPVSRSLALIDIIPVGRSFCRSVVRSLQPAGRYIIYIY